MSDVCCFCFTAIANFKKESSSMMSTTRTRRGLQVRSNAWKERALQASLPYLQWSEDPMSILERRNQRGSLPYQRVGSFKKRRVTKIRRLPGAQWEWARESRLWSSSKRRVKQFATETRTVANTKRTLFKIIPKLVVVMMTTTRKILPILMAARTWTDVDGSFVASIVGLGRRHHFLDLFENGGTSCYYLGHPGQGAANVGKCCAVLSAVAICCSNLAIN